MKQAETIDRDAAIAILKNPGYYSLEQVSLALRFILLITRSVA